MTDVSVSAELKMTASSLCKEAAAILQEYNGEERQRRFPQLLCVYGLNELKKIVLHQDSIYFSLALVVL